MKGKVKIIISIVVLLIIIAIAGCAVYFLGQDKEVETAQIEWEEIYLDVLKDEENFEDLEDLKIQLCDFDKDEIPELVVYGSESVKSGTSQMTKYLAKIYKLNKNNEEASTIKFDLEDEFQMQFLHNKETNDYNWYVVTDDEDIYDIYLEDDDYKIENSEYDYEDDFEIIDENVNKIVDFDKDATSKEIKELFKEVKENYLPVSELVPNEKEIDEKDDDNEVKKKTSDVKNNCGYIVEYKDNKYYWKLTKDSRNESGIYANYTFNEDNENELIKINKDGKEEVILKDNSISNLAIANEKIYYSTDDEICSVDLDGENKTVYSKGEIKCVIGNDVICGDDNDIFMITEDGKEEILAEKVKFIGNTDEYIYYTTKVTTKKSLDLGIIYNGKDKGIVQSLSTSEYEYNYNDVPSTITSLQNYKGKIYISYGYIDGTAGLIQESLLGMMDEDGSNYEMIAKGLMSEDFYIYEDDGEILLVYEEGKAVNTESKELVEVNTKLPCTSELVYKDIDGKIWFIDELTGNRKEIISETDLSEDYDFEINDEYMSTVYNYSIVNDDVYLIIDNGVHDPDNDIGWRYSYKREKTIVFKYNLDTKKLEKVYEF